MQKEIPAMCVDRAYADALDPPRYRYAFIIGRTGEPQQKFWLYDPDRGSGFQFVIGEEYILTITDKPKPKKRKAN